jgi:dienelactone hydrolase
MPATAGDTPDVLVRARHGAVAVPGLDAPYDTVHYRIFHPARRSGDDRERLTGVVPPDPTLAPWPVVIFLPGINIGPEGYRWLAMDLASAGYATVTMELVGDTLPGVVGITPGLDLDAVRPDTYLTRPSGVAIGPLLAALAAEHAEGPLAGLLDLDRVVLAGHSGGGSVALQNANPDWFPGVVGCATYASHTMASSMLGFEPETVLPVAGDVPTLLLAGELDGVMARSADRYQSADPSSHDPVARTFDEAVRGGRADCWYAVAAGATHTALIWPPDPTTARGFLDPPPGRDPERIRADLGTAFRLFLDVILAGEDPAGLDAHLGAGGSFVTWRRK